VGIPHFALYGKIVKVHSTSYADEMVRKFWPDSAFPMFRGIFTE